MWSGADNPFPECLWVGGISDLLWNLSKGASDDVSMLHFQIGYHGAKGNHNYASITWTLHECLKILEDVTSLLHHHSPCHFRIKALWIVRARTSDSWLAGLQCRPPTYLKLGGLGRGVSMSQNVLISHTSAFPWVSHTLLGLPVTQEIKNMTLK